MWKCYLCVFVFALMSSMVWAAPLETWDLNHDFPQTEPFPSPGQPIHNWIFGANVVQYPTGGLTPNTDYIFDYWGYYAPNQWYSMRSTTVLSAPVGTPNIILNHSTSTGGFGMQPYGLPGCVTVCPYFKKNGAGTADDDIVDNFVRWQAPVAGYYNIFMGANQGAANVTITISLNGTPVAGFNQVNTSTNPSYSAVGQYLNAGDTLQLLVHALGGKADDANDAQNTTPIYAQISRTATPGFDWSDSFEYPDMATAINAGVKVRRMAA